ncbi:hypothetical protein LIX60_18050 [Streptomyces sp. S07_1.15]|uniref:hypothetical protein n=1 Tax=Streptomyces sp. S07_1.15 TaxID=2873925 RepID=UPI001D156059|nr:hypothetical protein [Streptomyces sp. S07_1.15]MCC3653329.1 hypothetical protein [Streptomyces sp. S07_1.15]
MKLRHVRTVAVCALVLVTLTGARGSRSGGGCDDNSGSGSHSSSGGSYGDSGSSSSGGSGVTSGGSGSRNSALRDITIDTCGFDASGKNMTATLRVDNTAGSLDYEYDITVVFKETSGVTAGTARVDDFPVTSGRTGTTEATTPYTGTGDGSEVTKCEVRRASRSSV